MKRRVSASLVALIPAAVLAVDPPQEGTFEKAFAYVDPVGAPIASVQTPVLQPGIYELQTTDLQPLPTSVTAANTVVTLRDSALVNATTLAGASECYVPGSLFDFERSCFRFEVETPTDYWVWIRSWITSSAGRTDVRIQGLPSMAAPTDDRDCTTSSMDGCWTALANDITFGGLVLNGAILGEGVGGLIQLETTEQPGDHVPRFPSVHAILFAGDNGDETAAWNLRSNGGVRPDGTYPGGPASHRSRVGGTAQWTGYGTDAGLSDANPNGHTVIAGPVGTGALSPLRVVRNDRITFVEPEVGTVTEGVDHDADGLGVGLEKVLSTCDWLDSPDAGGHRCDDRPGCDGSDLTLCAAALRDSDGDALRDDHELYGVALNGGAPQAGGALARYGANPAKYDVMVEVDYGGAYNERTADCEPATGAQLTALELRDAVSVFANLTSFTNRNGTTGIALHVDGGVDPLFPADRGDYGDWGQSEPAVCRDQDKPSVQDSIVPHRRWLFRHVDVYDWGGGGSTGVPNSFYSSAGAAWAMVHELGHQGGLAHGGPRLTPGINHNPIYLSRINYNYEAWGEFGAEPRDPRLDEVSFSSGTLGDVELDPWNLDECCPFGSGTDTRLLRAELQKGSIARRHRVVDDPATGCLQVDWNRDGEISPTCDPVQARILRSAPHLPRATISGNFELWRGGTGLAVMGDFAVQSRLIRAGGGVEPRLHVLGPAACAECLPPGGTYDTGCWPSPGPDDVYEPLDEDGRPITDAVTIAVAGLAPSSGGAVVAYVVRRPRGLEWGTLDPGTRALHRGGELPAGEAPSTADGEQMLALATSIPDELVLAYRAADGTVYTQQGRATTTTAIRWREAVVAQGPDGLLVATPETAVGLARTYGALGDGLVLAVPGVDSLELFSRPAAGVEWRPIASLSTTVHSRPSLAQVSYPSGDRLVATWLGNDDVPLYNESDIGDLGGWFPEVPCHPVDGCGGSCATGRSIDGSICEEAKLVHGRYRAADPIALAWDDRPGAAPGLRAIYVQLVKCGAGCGTLPATCSSPGDGCEAAGGMLVYGKEYLVPFFDGIAPLRLYDYDDSPMLRQDYCAVLRTCDTRYWGLPCVPADYRELDAAGTPYGGRLCDPAEYPPRECTPSIPEG